MVEGAEQDPEELSEIHVVWGLLKPEATAVVEVHGKLSRKALAQNFYRRGHFLLTDLLILLFLGCSLKPLPGEAAPVEVHEDIAQALHVVPPTLLNAKVCVDGCISGSSCQILVLPVRDVLSSPVVSVLLRQTKVDEEEFVAVATNAHKEVIGLDIAVDEVLVVNILYATNHLISQHQDSLHGESSRAKVEEILQTRTQEIHDQDIVISLLTIPPDVRDSHPALQDLVELALIEELGVPSFHTLQLHGHFLPIGDVNSQVNITKTARPDFPHQSVFSSHYEL